MSTPVRRIVTGHDEQGRAIIVSDGITPIVHAAANRPGYAMNEVWCTYTSPAEIDRPGETTDRPRNLEPPTGGTVCRVVEFPPEAAWIDGVDRDKAREAFASLGAGHAADASGTPAHPLMHRTKTVDYGIILSGEIWLVMDEGETLCREGDVIVQLATNHAWSNRADKPCRVAFILMDGKWTGKPGYEGR